MSRTWVSTVALISIMVGALLALLQVGAVEGGGSPNGGLRVRAEGDAVTIRWVTPAGGQVDAAADLPQMAVGGYLLPMQTIAVRLAPGAEAAVASLDVESRPWLGTLQPALQETPPALGWEPIPSMLPKVEGSLPHAPVFVLRQGRLRGVAIAIVAFSPIFQDPAGGALRQVDEMEARIDQATPVPALDALVDARMAAGTGPEAAAAPVPSNPLAGGAALKIFVTQAGIQQVGVAELAAAGFADPTADRLRLFWRGVEIPLEIVDENDNGVLDAPEDALRFYAGQPRDRWNPEDVYWLVVGDTPGLRMAARLLTPDGAPMTEVAVESGRWSQSLLYRSLFAGADGDHWFHSDVKTDPSLQGDPNQYPTFSLILDHRLPPVTGSADAAQLTFAATAYDAREAGSSFPDEIPYQLQLRSEAFTIGDDADDWIVDFGLGAAQDLTRTYTLPAPSTALSVTLLATERPNGLLFDAVEWQLPVHLQFGGQGATFGGRAGKWTYSLAGLPPGATIYDISEPLRPQTLARSQSAPAAFLPFVSGAGGMAASTHAGSSRWCYACDVTSPVVAAEEAAGAFEFEDGPAVHQYLVAGAGTVFSPRVEAHAAVSFGADGAAVVYIGPAAFEAALQPLLDQRASQGYAAKFVDVQAIYDAWSFGMVDPEAIRSFLRYAVATYKPAPIATVLVGDGTRDPYDYSAYGIRVSVIPPYLARVDPWLGEAPCDNCYAQLDGDNPLSETAFFTDIWLGRFPVTTPDEVATIVGKILAYENSPDRSAPWRAVSVQLADDYLKADGSRDPAGNFPAFVEGVIQLQPAKIQTERNYYNAPIDTATLPPDLAAFYTQIGLWIEGDPSAALHKSIAYLDRGAGLVTFTGHSHHWQWAVTDRNNPDGRLFGLWDVLNLSNRDRLFIGLSMTCYTSQFDVPAPYHYTLDEHLVLYPDGGAVATWGPAGLSVSHGHDAIQQGFYQALWQARPMEAKLGELVQAGYTYLITKGTCCQDIARTFTLLGDPLTPARVQPLDSVYLPAALRNPRVTAGEHR